MTKIDIYWHIEALIQKCKMKKRVFTFAQNFKISVTVQWNISGTSVQSSLKLAPHEGQTRVKSDD